MALDIGTTKICVLIGQRDKHGKIEILGHGRVESQGVLRGVVSNIEKQSEVLTKHCLKHSAKQAFL